MERVGKSRVRFGVFEADLASRELWRLGRKIRLQDQPFQLLTVFLKRPREVVTKDELIEHLWGDTPPSAPDHSLSIAIGKIRSALRDEADNPRFIETLPSGAYRFIASVEFESPAGDEDEEDDAIPRPFMFPLLGVGVAAAAALILWFPPIEDPETTKTKTTKTQPRTFTIECDQDCSSPVVSPDHRYIAFVSGAGEGTLWVHDLQKDERRELAGTDGANYPFWHPEGRWIGFAAANDLKKVRVNDGNVEIVTPLVDRSFWGGSWSPDGRSIVFSVHSPGSLPRLYEVDARGGDRLELLFEPTGEERKMGFGHPHFLPLPEGPRMLLYGTGFPSRSDIILRNLDTGKQDILEVGASPLLFTQRSHSLSDIGLGRRPLGLAFFA